MSSIALPYLTRREVGGILLGTAAVVAMPAWPVEPYNWPLGFRTPPPELDGELKLVSGHLPSDLRGVLYRNGPAQFERAGVRLDHWFDGDGMIQRFVIGDGRVRHRGRFVATDKRRAEEKAKRFLYSGYGFSPPDPAPVRRPDDINAANTHVLAIGSELWALWEGGSPWRLDAENLETIGRKSFSGAFDGVPFSAHPKQGPDGDIWNFGAFGSRCVIWQLAPDGQLKKATPIDLPVPALMHDFAVTERHIVLVLPPLHRSGASGNTLIDQYSWQPNRPLQVLVLEKDDLTRRRLYELPARFLFHIGNAWEDSHGAIRLDAFLMQDAEFATHSARDLPSGRYVDPPNARLTLLTLYPNGRSATETHEGAGEFPRTDPRLVGQEHRYTYGIAGSGIACWDWRDGRKSTYFYGDDYWAEEPVFVPRPRQSGENNGWLVATALNTRSGRTELAVFDAKNIAGGPIALFECPYALPLGFHGVFNTNV